MKECKLGSGVQLQAVLKQESIKQTGIKKRAGVYCKKMSESYCTNSFYCLRVISNIVQCCRHHHHLYEITYFLHTDFGYRGGQSLQKSRRHLKILGTKV
jgi:hypothetical protein